MGAWNFARFAPGTRPVLLGGAKGFVSGALCWGWLRAGGGREQRPAVDRNGLLAELSFFFTFSALAAGAAAPFCAAASGLAVDAGVAGFVSC